MVKNRKKLSRELFSNVAFTNTLKDPDVRKILQRIREKIIQRQTSLVYGFEDDDPSLKKKLKIYIKIPSLSNKIDIFEGRVNVNGIVQDSDYDDNFMFFISGIKVISNLKYESRHPNEKKGHLDFQMLDIHEYEKPYVAASFIVKDEQFFLDASNLAADILIENAYPSEKQVNIVRSALLRLKNETNNQHLILTWKEIDLIDAPHIEIIKVFKILQTEIDLKVNNIELNLDNTFEDGRVFFKADVTLETPIKFTDTKPLSYKSLHLYSDTKTATVVYPLIPKKQVKFRLPQKDNKINKLYTLLKKYIDSSNKSLTDIEIYSTIYPFHNKPREISRIEYRKIEWVINNLKKKLHNMNLFERTQDGYRFTP